MKADDLHERLWWRKLWGSVFGDVPTKTKKERFVPKWRRKRARMGTSRNLRRIKRRATRLSRKINRHRNPRSAHAA